jgi:acetyl-CoA carboxylase carboxyltransferase component
LIPEQENKTFDMRRVLERVVDADSFFEIKKLFAKELLTGFARIDGMPVGIVANQPKSKGGVLFVDSADKAARFIMLCDAFGLPLVFLADVPGFMVGVQVEREGIIRAGAKMIHAMSSATVPRFSVIVRKAYGAGLYAMSGPGFEPEATLALPGAMIAVMGPEAAVNAVYFNKLQSLPEAERVAEEERLRDEYRDEIDIERLASELAIDAVVPPRQLRDELVARLQAAWGRRDPPPPKRGSVVPV